MENWDYAKRKIVNTSALLIAVGDPLTLSIMKTPGDCGADVFVGEGQSIGTPMNYGGPLLGLIAAKEKYKRRIPGRIVGKTLDTNNAVGFVLTLQTREQHIRRENATSNICTNQGLIALRATINMALMGKSGLPALAKMCYEKAHYTASRVSELENISLMYGMNFVKEFTIKINGSAKGLQKSALKKLIFINTLDDDETDTLIQICVTEKRTRSEIDSLVDFLKTS